MANRPGEKCKLQEFYCDDLMDLTRNKFRSQMLSSSSDALLKSPKNSSKIIKIYDGHTLKILLLLFKTKGL